MSGPIDFSRYEGHTPGPWEWRTVEEEEDHDGLYSATTGEAVLTAASSAVTGFTPCVMLSGIQADEHLIIEAPMLLARLEAVHVAVEQLKALATECVLFNRPFAVAYELAAMKFEQALNGEVEGG